MSGRGVDQGREDMVDVFGICDDGWGGAVEKIWGTSESFKSAC